MANQVQKNGAVSTAVTLYIAPELNERLKEAAAKEQRSVSNFVSVHLRKILGENDCSA